MSTSNEIKLNAQNIAIIHPTLKPNIASEMAERIPGKMNGRREEAADKINQPKNPLMPR